MIMIKIRKWGRYFIPDPNEGKGRWE